MTMLVQVHGCGGSGKTTVARKLFALFGGMMTDWYEREPFYYARLDDEKEPGLFEPKRKDRVMGHRLVNMANGMTMDVIGSYTSTECGGADKISPPDLTYELVRRRAAAGADVVFLEGLLLGKCSPQRYVNWPGELLLVQLNTSPEESLRSMNERRARAGKEPFEKGDNRSWANIMNSHGTTLSVARRVAEAGRTVLHLDRDEAPGIILDWITNPIVRLAALQKQAREKFNRQDAADEALNRALEAIEPIDPGSIVIREHKDSTQSGAQEDERPMGVPPKFGEQGGLF